MQKKVITGIVIVALALLLWPVIAKLGSKGDITSMTGNAVKYGGDITFYRSQSCGCCGLYLDYLKSRGKLNVNEVQMDDLTNIKSEKGIPADLQSCHTSIIGKYFVEGHVPLEAINKLLAEQPDIKGLAIAGMPSGAPGMPGGKKSPFVIYAVNNDGSSEEYMTL